MDNKGGKTFSDLFSDMSNDSDSVTSHESKEKITFDNLFDKAAEKGESNSDIFKTKTEDNDCFVETNKDTKEKIVFDDLFSNTKDQTVQNSDIFSNAGNVSFHEEIKDDKKDYPSTENNEPTSINNLFFNVNSNSLEKNLDLKADDVSFGSELNLESTNSLSEKNPFFPSDDDKKEKLSSHLENVSPNLSSNDMSNKDKEDFGKSEESFLNMDLGNIFFNQKNDSSEILSQVQSNDSINSLENKKNFENSGDNFLEKNKPLEKKEAEEENKVISPFFEEISASNMPSSDLEKINLIENESQPKKMQKLDLDKLKHYSVKIEKKKEPLFKFILGVLSYAIFIWLLLIGVALLVYVLDIKIRASKGDYSSPTFNAYVVLTGSMLPEIQVNDVVVTKKVDASTLNVGDVITFASADSRFLNTIITHRIIKKEYDSKTKSYSFQTQGDNNNVADSALVPQNNIYGKVILKIPKLGYLQEFLASDGGWIIVILIPCLTVISYDVVKLFKGLKKKKSKNMTIQK